MNALDRWPAKLLKWLDKQAFAGGVMSSSFHIAVVDDEEIVSETVQEYLLRQGYAVTGASGGPKLRRSGPTAPQAIRTVRGAGYNFVPAGEVFHG